MTAALVVSAFSGAVVSAVVPVVNTELLAIGLAMAAPPAAAPLLVLALASGQMVGKSALFLTGGRLSRVALEGRLARWRLDGRAARAGAPLVGLSAFAGLPPFYLVAVAAPAVGIRFGTFLLFGLLGRLARFGLLIGVPELLTGITT